MPSSGFPARVMEAVADAVVHPRPLPFPWIRFVIGAIACGAWAISVLVLLRPLTSQGELVAKLATVGPELSAAILLAAACLFPSYHRRIKAG